MKGICEVHGRLHSIEALPQRPPSGYGHDQHAAMDANVGPRRLEVIEGHVPGRDDCGMGLIRPLIVNSRQRRVISHHVDQQH